MTHLWDTWGVGECRFHLLRGTLGACHFTCGPSPLTAGTAILVLKFSCSFASLRTTFRHALKHDSCYSPKAKPLQDSVQLVLCFLTYWIFSDQDAALRPQTIWEGRNSSQDIWQKPLETTWEVSGTKERRLKT